MFKKAVDAEERFEEALEALIAEQIDIDAAIAEIDPLSIEGQRNDERKRIVQLALEVEQLKRQQQLEADKRRAEQRKAKPKLKSKSRDDDYDLEL